MYFGGGGMREQNALAKSLLGNSTGVREAVPAQGPEAEAGGSCRTSTPLLPSTSYQGCKHWLPAEKSINKVISPSKTSKLPYSAGLGQHLRTIYHSVARKAL